MGSRVKYDWGVLVLHHGYLLSKVLEAVKRERDAYDDTRNQKSIKS